ncbi:MAG TPA: AI-2E family transporter [Sphingomicrobium sp.]|nr:AI-2E family transporter [Sphingomicrobium sp.]
MQVSARKEASERSGFLLFLALITVALTYVAWPFASALLWAVLAAIMFQPLYQWMLPRLSGRENRAAVATLLIITVAVVVPAIAIGNIIVGQVLQIYAALQSGGLDAAGYFEQAHENLPARLRSMLDASGYGDFDVLQDRISAFLRDSVGLIASRALVIGGNALAFVLAFAVGLYVTYFLLRDGRRIGATVKDTLPLDRATAERLTSSFVAIVRATIKGSIVVGLVQGLLGTITFWIVGFPSAVLLGLLMAIFSLLPAVGPALVWVPIAAYLLLTGSIWQGVVVIVSGALIIGLADNLLRPVLVGRDTGIPDWLVLVTTLGGIAAFGLSGIVVGPVVAGLFLAGWSIYREQRHGSAVVGES